MQLDTVSRRELCCLSMWDKLKLAAARIDASEYRDVALALVSLDVPVGQVKRLGAAILAVRGDVWDGLREQLTNGRRKAA